MLISNIIIGNRTRKNLGDIQQLASSITTIGLLHPIVVTPDNRLVAGYRRIMAYKLLGHDDIPHVTVSDLQDLLFTLAEQHENTCRLDFTPSEAVEMGRQFEPFEKTPVGRPTNNGGKLPPLNKGKTRDKVGQIVGLSGKTYTKAKKIVEAAEENPTLQSLVIEMDSTRKVDPVYKKLNKTLADIAKGDNPQLPPNIKLTHGDMLVELPNLGLFDLVIADPPYNVTNWDWDKLGTEFIPLTRQWLEVTKQSLKPQYNLFWFCSPQFSADIEMILRELDLPIQSRIVWHRRNMAKGSHAKDKFIDTWEMIFHCGNRPLNFPKKWNAAWFDVQEFAVPQTNFKDEKLHPTQKPVDLIKRLVGFGSYPGDRILDPFAGSGTTGAACPDGRECVLIEKDKGYCDIIKNRLGI